MQTQQKSGLKNIGSEKMKNVKSPKPMGL